MVYYSQMKYRHSSMFDGSETGRIKYISHFHYFFPFKINGIWKLVQKWKSALGVRSVTFSPSPRRSGDWVSVWGGPIPFLLHWDYNIVNVTGWTSELMTSLSSSRRCILILRVNCWVFLERWLRSERFRDVVKMVLSSYVFLYNSFQLGSIFIVSFVRCWLRCFYFQVFQL